MGRKLWPSVSDFTPDPSPEGRGERCSVKGLLFFIGFPETGKKIRIHHCRNLSRKSRGFRTSIF
jgi:hypothetical protein